MHRTHTLTQAELRQIMDGILAGTNTRYGSYKYNGYHIIIYRDKTTPDMSRGQKYKVMRKDSGLCIWCMAPVPEGQALCEDCRIKNQKRTQARYK